MKRRRHTRKQWLDWLIAQPGSGLSVTAFCRKAGVSENSFYLWRRKLKNELEPNRLPNALVPVSVVGTGQVEVDLPCGATIRLPPDESAMRQVFSVLLELSRESPGAHR